MLKDRIPKPDSGNPESLSGHVPALDGIRGMAILAVMGCHMFMSNSLSSNLLIQVVLSIRDRLWIGVILFFALSGFLITGILYDTLNAEHYFRSFFGRRILRIFPLYYGVLIVLLLLTRPLNFNWQGQAYRLLTYTPNIPFVPDWYASPSKYINMQHFWSLAVEEQFYVIWPFVVFWLKSWRKIVMATLVGAAISLGFRTTLAAVGMWPANHTLPGCMDALLLGGCLAMLVRSKYKEATIRWGAPVFLIAMAITIAAAVIQGQNFIWEKSFYLTTIGLTIIPVGMTGLVAWALHTRSIAQRFCATKPLRFFGRYSYGLYIYHYSLYEAAKFLLWPRLQSHGVPVPVVILLVGVVAFVASVMLAVLSYELYEKWFLKLKRNFPYRQRPHPVDSTSLLPQASKG